MADRVTTALIRAQHEPQDVGPRFILILLAGISTSLLALIALAYFMFPRQVQDRRFTQPFPVFPPPRLQSDPPADWKRFHTAELQALNGTGWVDRAKGIVHIPIDQAMRDIAANGIPGWPLKPVPPPAVRR